MAENLAEEGRADKFCTDVRMWVYEEEVEGRWVLEEGVRGGGGGQVGAQGGCARRVYRGGGGCSRRVYEEEV